MLSINIMPRKVLAWILFTLGSLMALSTNAAQDRYQLDAIVVTGRPAAAPLNEVAGSVGTVDQDLLGLVRHSHIAESADRISGVWISRGNGQEHLTAIRSPVLTGPGSCGDFLILEDGIPTRPAGFCNVNQLFEINSEQAESIEIFKGPNSAVYGGNAVHGVINVLSPAMSNKKKTSIMLDGGPHDYARAFISYSDGKNTSINAHSDHDGGYIDNSGFDQQKINVKHVDNHYDYLVESFIEITNLNQESAGYLVGTDAYKNDSLKRTNSNPEAFRDAESIHGYQRYTFIQSDKNEFQITPYANASHMAFLQHFVPSEPLERNGHASIGVNGRLNYPLLDFPSDMVSMNSGFNIETARAYVNEFQSNLTIDPPGFVQGQHYDFDVMMNSLALSSEIEYSFSQSIKTIAGGRYDYQFYNYKSKTPADTVGVYTRPASRTDEFGNWGLNAGVLWDWTITHQVFVNASTGFRAPQVAELYRLEGGQPADSVKSEQIDSVELGLRGNVRPMLGDSLVYDLVVFDMHKDHVILKQSNRQYLGDGKTSHRGVELSMNYRFLPTAFMKATVTHAEHRYEHVSGQLQGSPTPNVDGNMIDTAPRHYGSVQLGKMYKWGLAELEMKHLGPYYLGPENTLKYKGHNLLNLRAEWILSTDWKIGVRLLNLLDKDYAERADATPLSPAPRYFVGEPRSLYLSITRTY